MICSAFCSALVATATVVLAAPAGVQAPTPSSAPPVATVRFTLSDPRLSEISGLAPGSVSPSVMYAENDSGHPAQFFALDARTGAVRGVYDVPGARNVDWEDLAVAPDAQGRPSVWLADVGDNDATRSAVQVYRVDEPRLRSGQVVGTVDTARPDVWTLRYPDGPVNAESLMVTPRGIGYVVTKSVLGVSTVFRMPANPGTATLTPVGTMRFTPTNAPDPFGLVGQLTATGAAISPDGTALAVRTYSSAYLWPVRDGDVAAALTAAPVRVTLPLQPQGESIAFAGADLLVASEGVGTPVYQLAAPHLGPAASAPTRTPASSAPGTRILAAPSGPAAPSTPDRSKAKHPGINLGTVLILVMLVLIGGAGWLAANRRRLRRPGPGPRRDGDDRPGSSP